MTKKHTTTQQKFIDYLQERHRPVKSKELERAFGINGIEVRAIVNRLRRKGFPIGSSAKGYFICRTASEVEHTINNLNSRIEGMAGAVNGLEKARKSLC